MRPSPSPQVSFTSSRVPWARSRMTVRKSSSAVALKRCWPRESSRHCSGARKSFCSYFARIQRSFSSLEKSKETGQSNLAPLALNGGTLASKQQLTNVKITTPSKTLKETVHPNLLFGVTFVSPTSSLPSHIIAGPRSPSVDVVLMG